MSEYHAVQVAATDRPEKTTTKQMLGHFKKSQVNPKRIVKEFAVTPDAHVPVGVLLLSQSLDDHCTEHISAGTTFSAVHFVPGQYVDVVAKS